MRGPILTPILFAATLVLAAGSPRAQVETGHAFLLVAKRGMLDANFAQTVVLAVRPDDGGPVGVILNRPSTVELRSLYPGRAEIAGRRDLVFLGGPVEPDALLFAFRSPRKPSKGLFVADDIYLSGFSEVLAELLKHPENAGEQRFFTGFSGWAAGQLEDEIARGGWYVLRFDARAVFDMDPLTMYEEMLRRATVPRIEAARGIHLARAVPR
ncbi:MAG: YqgE/AlgH family protein [Betaproteobacteria bacterium]|nr:YqgE/AlgH family protein [Betaproteobacteria bacterium]